MSDQAYGIESDELRSFVERIEAQDARVKEETEARKQIYDEAGGSGYDKKVLRRIVALRKKKPDQIAEEDAVEDMYRSALGMP